MLEQNLTVVRVAGPVDYRTVATADGGFAAGRFVRTSDTEPPALSERVALTVGTRTVTASAVRDRAVWFEFAVLCGTPTAPADYLELSERFGCWAITGVPRLRETGAETVRRFANVVDVLYDRGDFADPGGRSIVGRGVRRTRRHPRRRPAGEQAVDAEPVTTEADPCVGRPR